MEGRQAVRSWSRVLVVIFAAWWGSSSDAFAQQAAKPAEAPAVAPSVVSPAANDARLSIEQEQALALIRQLVSELKSEADKSSAALIQARAADVLWKFDEVEARSLFRLAFDSANQPIPETSTIDKDEKARHLKLLQQQATAVRNILTLFGRHDHAAAEAWLDSLKEKPSTKPDKPNQLSQDRAEFLAQLALQEVKTNPAEAQKLALLSLNAPEVPAAVGQVLVALKNLDRAKGNVLFEATVAALRMNFNGAPVILSTLSNYLFFSNGALFESADAPRAAMFMDYLVDAANTQLARWQAQKANNSSMTDSAASLLNFLAFRGLTILKVNAPDKLYRVQPVFNELSAQLNEQQLANLNQLSAARSPTSSDAANDVDDALQKAEREKDPVARDDLRRSLAIRVMREDPEKALSIAGRIDDLTLRAITEDDVNLVASAQIPRGAYVEARRIFSRFHDQNLRAKCLTELAARTYSISNNRNQAIELFSEAYEIALKGDRTADRADVLLLLVEKVASLDPERSFEFLSAAITATNQAKEDSTSASPAARRVPRIIRFTMVGGLELTTGKHATLDGLSFENLGPTLRRDYYRARNLGDNIQNKMIRAKYLLALALSTLDPGEKKPVSTPSI
jgi:hypothetical protein